MVKKKEISPTEKLEKMIKTKIAKEIKKCFFDKEIMKLLLDNQIEYIECNHAKLWNLTEKKFKKMEKTLKSMEKINDINEQTMSNMLLAIRQNEYLQAWYPAQRGYKEMHVIGEHPIVTDRREKCR